MGDAFSSVGVEFGYASWPFTDKTGRREMLISQDAS